MGCGERRAADNIAFPQRSWTRVVLPTGPWHLRTVVAVAAFCAAHGACAQPLEELPIPPPQSEEAPPLLSLPTAAPAAEASEAPGGISNADVQSMAEAKFSDSMIITVIDANEVAFDLSPRALVALKSAGVSEPVIEAMLAAEAEKKRALQPEPTPTQLAETQASVDYAKLTEMIERLAAQQEAAEKARRAPDPPASRADPAPRVWLVNASDRAAIAPTIAQVAFAGGSSRRGELLDHRRELRVLGRRLNLGRLCRRGLRLGDLFLLGLRGEHRFDDRLRHARALQRDERARRQVELDGVGIDHGDDRRIAERGRDHLLNVRVADRPAFGRLDGRERRRIGQRCLGRRLGQFFGRLAHGERRLGLDRKRIGRQDRHVLDRFRGLRQRFSLRARDSAHREKRSESNEDP